MEKVRCYNISYKTFLPRVATQGTALYVVKDSELQKCVTVLWTSARMEHDTVKSNRAHTAVFLCYTSEQKTCDKPADLKLIEEDYTRVLTPNGSSTIKLIKGHNVNGYV